MRSFMTKSSSSTKSKTKKGGATRCPRCQTLRRGLDVLEAVASGASTVPDFAATVKLKRSTAHRLASTLVEKRYLSFVMKGGYGLGPKILELGYQAREQLNVPRSARQHLERLAAQTGDTVHLAVREGKRSLYLDKIPGRRRVDVRSRVGELQPLPSTGLGKALILDEDDVKLRELYRCENGMGQAYGVAEETWMRRMRHYAKNGYTFDLEENEDRIRWVAAPVRDVTGRITAAISVSGAAHYMDDERMRDLIGEVREVAERISQELGYEAPTATPGKKTQAA
jgi:DNA-binding IclR family transcriptional regulator